jgi:hypothetical protein
MILKEDDFRAIGDIIRINLEPMQSDLDQLKTAVATKVNIEEIMAEIATIIDRRCDRLEMMILNQKDVTAQNTIDIEQLRRKA